MTNYEWLCKENKIAEFIIDISSLSLNDIRDVWKIEEKTNHWFDDVAEWLQSEHKATKWVRLDDVSDIIFARLIYSDAKPLNAEISELETKEIEDD